MLRRFLGGADTQEQNGALAAVEKLLQLRLPGERSAWALKHVCAVLPGEVRGYVVIGNELGEYKFEALRGFATSLFDLHPKHGPWRDPGPRLIPNLVAELFTPNTREERQILGDHGLRDAKSSLVVPASGRESRYGAMILHRFDGLFSDSDLHVATQWGTVLGLAQGQAEELHRTRMSLVEFSRAFVEAMESQDFSQLGHAQRVAAYALALGRAMEFSREQLADLYFAAMLHDIGKLGSGLDFSVEDAHHPLRGANMVASSKLLRNAAEGIRSHHENWDGSGFPKGLRKEEIPLLGRLVAVADVFDLLSSERGQALPIHEVEKGLEARSGKQLDPELVRLMVNILRQGRSTKELAQVDDSELPF